MIQLIEKHTSILISTVTFLLGLLIGHRLALGRDKRKEFNDCAEQFRSVFLEAVHRLTDQDNEQGIYEFLEGSFALFKKAVISFRSHLHKRKRRAFDRAWNSYRYGINSSDPQPEMELPLPILTQYFEGLSSDDQREKTRELILSRVNKMLTFAETK